MSEHGEGDERENHQTWRWSRAQNAWVYMMPHHIYEHPDGTFSVSTGGVWHNGFFATFADAEAAALGLDAPYVPQEQTNE